MSKEFAQRIDAVINGYVKETGGQLRWGNAKEAKLLLNRISQVQKELRLIKKEIGMVKQQIRAEFAEARTDVAKSGGLTSFFFGSKGRAAVARDKARKRVNLRESQEDASAPYDHLIAYIDGKLIDFDRTKLEIQQKTATMRE